MLISLLEMIDKPTVRLLYSRFLYVVIMVKYTNYYAQH